MRELKADPKCFPEQAKFYPCDFDILHGLSCQYFFFNPRSLKIITDCLYFFKKKAEFVPFVTPNPLFHLVFIADFTDNKKFKKQNM